MVHFCENCRSYNTSYVKDVELTKEIKGEIYIYNGKLDYCTNCNEEIFIDELVDYNLEQLNTEYRKKIIE